MLKLFQTRYETDESTKRNPRAAAAAIYGRLNKDGIAGGMGQAKRSNVAVQFTNCETVAQAEIWVQLIQVDDQCNAVRLNGEYQAHPNRLVIKGGIENKDTMGNVTVLSDGETCGKNISLSRI